MKIRVILLTVVLVIGFLSFDYIVVARLGYLWLQCATPSDQEKISRTSKLSIKEQFKISSKIFECVEKKQSSLERLIIKVPEKWINPPTKE